MINLTNVGKLTDFMQPPLPSPLAFGSVYMHFKRFVNSIIRLLCGRSARENGSHLHRSVFETIIVTFCTCVRKKKLKSIIFVVVRFISDSVMVFSANR